MTDLGFWRLGTDRPDWIALVDPDGNQRTAGELVTAANQISHGLRALGVQTGDTVTVLLPNSIEFVQLYLGALQIGCYLTPINHHLVGPEIAYIVNDSDAKVVIGDERFADVLVKARTEVELGDEGLFAVGNVPGWRPIADLTDGQPTHAPPD